MRTIHTITLLTAFLVGCEKTETIVVPGPAAPPTTMEQVIANVHIVDEALVAYAAGHGYYPYHSAFSGFGFDGDLRLSLPDSLLLVNPVTGERTEPRHIEDIPGVWSGAPERPAGSVIYMPYVEWVADDPLHWVNTGYELNGIGPVGEVYELSRLPAGAFDHFERVRQNCAIVLAAAESYAVDNNGVYAYAYEDNAAGKRLIDYLPERQLLENPWTHYRSEPKWGTIAGNPGETGYLGVDSDGDGLCDGFTIDGMGTLPGELLTMRGGSQIP